MTVSALAPSPLEEPWWSCPDWCDESLCEGGEVIPRVGGAPFYDARTHTAVLHTSVVSDIEGDPTELKVIRQQDEFPGETFPDEYHLHIGDDILPLNGHVLGAIQALIDAARKVGA